MTVRQHPLARLIPSPVLQAQPLVGTTPAIRTKAIEDGYAPGGGIVGAFDLHPETWSHRISNYDRDEFRADTYGPHDFSEIHDSLSADDGDGCHVYTSLAFDWPRC